MDSKLLGIPIGLAVGFLLWPATAVVALLAGAVVAVWVLAGGLEA